MEAGKRTDGTRWSHGEGPTGAHSADVRISLRVGTETFAVAQIGGGRLIFAQPVTIRGDQGEVRMSVDGNERRWLVGLITAACRTAPSPSVEVSFKHLVEPLGPCSMFQAGDRCAPSYPPQQ